MKYLTFSLLALLTVIVGMAENAFVPGTVWTSYIQGVNYPMPPGKFETAILEGPEEGAEYMKMSVFRDDETSNETRVYYIRPEGEKIYFSFPTEIPEWKLLYDFNLTEGEEGTEIFSPWEVEGMPYLVTYDICVGTRVNEKGLTEMTMHEYGKLSDEEGYTPWFETGTWLKGIGSTFGVMRPNFAGVLGVGYQLVEVRNGDKVFYSNPSAVKELSYTDIGLSISNGKLIYTDVSEPTRIIISSADGGVLKQTFIVGSGSIELAPGLNIVRAGKTVLKGFGQ